MKSKSDTKIVIIGMGFLMGYIEPCYTEYVGKENVVKNIIAVTADEESVENKRKEFPFEIRLFDNLSALRDNNPDIILFAPPPSVAPKLIEEVLKVYFDELRKTKMPLPDIYAFPPSPVGKYYLDALGGDINVCNILPNMVKEINGKKLNGTEGNTHVTYPNEKAWPPENKKRLEQFFSPLGGVIDVKPEYVLKMLATLVTVESIPFALFSMVDALKKTGCKINHKDLATCMRGYFEEKYQYFPKNSTKCSTEILNADTRKIIVQFCDSWFTGIIDYLVEQGMEKDKARNIIIAFIDITLHACQHEERETLEVTAKDHATKGGVLERGILCFEALMKDKLMAVFADKKQDKYTSQFFDWIYNTYKVIAEVVALHGRRLSGSELPFEFTEEVHAVVFSLFVKNMLKLGGKEGKDAAVAGIKLYADQRGSRMAKYALKNGDELTMLNYMVYGEWRPKEGDMDIREHSKKPVTNRVYKCPWYTAWEKYGLLEEAEYYCKYIDKMLVKGYNKDLELKVNLIHTCGDECCEFVWDTLEFTDENLALLAEKKKSVGDSCLRSWKYHTGHIISAMSQAAKEILDNSDEVINKTFEDIGIIFGAKAQRLMQEIPENDYYSI